MQLAFPEVADTHILVEGYFEDLAHAVVPFAHAGCEIRLEDPDARDVESKLQAPGQAFEAFFLRLSGGDVGVGADNTAG